MFGFYRVAAAVPELKVADIDFNTDKIIKLTQEAEKNSAALIVFPELSVCGYTCADLFGHTPLIDKVYEALMKIAAATKKINIVTVVGAPVPCGNALYNCGVVIQSGKIRGIVPKTYVPNYREFYEKRWFNSAKNLQHNELEIGGEMVPFGPNYFFSSGRYFKFGIEICEDLWSVVPPSSYHSIAGSLITLNLSASDELVAKAEYRRELVKQQSGRCISAYVYSSSGVTESTTDLVFGGHSLITENGSLLAEGERFSRTDTMIYSDIDCAKLLSLRITESSFADYQLPEDLCFDEVSLGPVNTPAKLKREITAHPFVPSVPEKRSERCMEIFKIQSSGLAKRFAHTGAGKAVIGISGGLDSTLALLVCAETFKLLKKKPQDIIAITMPGFGTTDRTYGNAVELCKTLKVTLREVKIKDACLLHFNDIGHDPKIHDVTYENVQARERTQILMDTANKEGGLVIGTGDLSEIALGWSTYNGDHMSMYAVNCSVPKTLIRYLIQWVSDHSDKKLKTILEDIINTPVSPELLPASGKGEIVQKTEELIGPYELHDFFLYHMVKYGAEPKKIVYLAKIAFGKKYTDADIKKFLKLFIKRFFAQQYKRSCIPDGPKVGTISLSPRGDWRMPSDASAALWLKELE